MLYPILHTKLKGESSIHEGPLPFSPHCQANQSHTKSVLSYPPKGVRMYSTHNPPPTNNAGVIADRASATVGCSGLLIRCINDKHLKKSFVSLCFLDTLQIFICIQYRYKIHDKLYDSTDFVKVYRGGSKPFWHWTVVASNHRHTVTHTRDSISRLRSLHFPN